MASMSDMESIKGMFDGEMFGGWLFKRAPSGMMRPWSARFFVVSEEQLDAQIKYYTNSEKNELKGTINVQEITEIRDIIEVPKSMIGSSNEKQPPELRFDVVMKDRTYELCAPNSELKQKWLDILVKVSHIPLASAQGIDYALQGYLVKLSGGNNTRQKWDRRFFRLRNDDDVQALMYYKTETDTTPQGTIELSDVMEVREYSHETENIDMSALSGWVPPYDTRFEIKTHGRVFVLAETSTRSGSVVAEAEESDEPASSTVVVGVGSKEKWVPKLVEVCGVELNRELPCKAFGLGEGTMQLDENGIPIIPAKRTSARKSMLAVFNPNN